MGKKDISVNRWLSDKERFADLFNGSLFEGRQFIDPQKLTRLPIEQKSIINTIEGKKIPVEYFRDIIMFSEQDKKLCILACETQNKEHYAMVIRGMLYDSLSYMEQVQNIAKENRENKKYQNSEEFLSGIRKEDTLVPIITIVLFYGEEWRGSKDLYGLLGLDEETEKIFSPYITNYKINLIEPAKIADLSCYKSDLQYVFNVIQCKKDKEKLKRYIEENKEFFSEVSEETYDAICAFINAEKLLENHKKDDMTGGIDMCQALEEIYQDGIKDGIKDGMKVGLDKGIRSLVRACRDLGESTEGIIVRVSREYSLTEEEATEYVGK